MPLLRAAAATGSTASWVDTYADALTFSAAVTFTGANIQNNSGAIGAGGATLTSADSGTIYNVAQQAGAITITLPATATSAGVWYEFYLGTAAAGNATITADGAVIIGALVEGGAAATAVGGNTSVAFDGGTAAVGDHCKIRCDGTNWFISGIGTNANSWILA